MRREVYGEESGATKRNVIISSFVAVAIAVVAIANMGTARFTVIVLDEQTRRPIEDVDVIGCFANHYLRWENAAEEIVHHKHTDGWPSKSSYPNRWLHSDMKDVSYFFNFKFYEKAIEKGGLR